MITAMERKVNVKDIGSARHPFYRMFGEGHSNQVITEKKLIKAPRIFKKGIPGRGSASARS